MLIQCTGLGKMTPWQDQKRDEVLCQQDSHGWPWCVGPNEDVDHDHQIILLHHIQRRQRPQLPGSTHPADFVPRLAANAMYYPQQSPGIPHKLASHHDNNPWRHGLPMLVQQPGQQTAVGPPPQSPGYALYTNGALHQHPGHHLQHPPLQHHHQTSLSHYPSPPNQHSHQQQQHLLAAQGSPASATPVVSPQWQQQLMKCEVRRFAIYFFICLPVSCSRVTH